ncbi:MAG: hypothetical protein ABIJ48_03765 [Actinomycetota bacterium]
MRVITPDGGRPSHQLAAGSCPDHHGGMLRRWLPVGLALAMAGGAVAWALAGLPGRPVACSATGCDCETPGPGPVRQPANAWSSLTLVAAGVALLITSPVAAGPAGALAPRPQNRSRGGVKGPRARWASTAFALVLAGTAAFLFHAGLSAWAARLDGIAVGILVAALTAHRWWPRSSPVAAGSGGRPGLSRKSLWGTWLPWLLLAGGGVCWVLGRSGGPWCRPGSPLQAHAAWHLLVACAIFLWLRPGHPGDGDASPIPPRHLPSRREGEAAHEPAP